MRVLDKKTKFFPYITVAAILFMIIIYAPLEVLFNNRSDFWFDMWHLLGWMLPVWGISVVVGFGVLYVVERISNHMFNFLSLILGISYMGLYIQGNYLVGNLPLLDGNDILWEQYSSDRIKSIFLWLMLILLVVWYIRKKGEENFLRLGEYIVFFITAILAVTLIFLCVNTKSYQKKAEICVTDKNLWKYSTESNFIIFVLDSVNGQEMGRLLNAELGGQYEKIFDGFTFYNNMQGAYPFTGNSAAFILSGEWYENDKPSVAYFHGAYTDSRLLNELEVQKYAMGIYFDGLNNMDEDYYVYDNIMPSKHDTASISVLLKSMMQIVGIKYLPFDLKRLCVADNAFDTTSCLKMMIPDEDGVNVFDPDNGEFLERMQDNNIEFVEDKQFKYIHIDGAHAPFRYNKDVVETEEATYWTSVEASMTIISEYLTKLKKAGVYDNSIIIIMADHGYDSSSKKIEDSYLYRQNPMFFVKGYNEKHEMAESSAPISFVDLNETYERLIEGFASDKVFDYCEGEQRIRRWLYYEGGNGDIIEFEQSDAAWNRETLYPTGNKFVYGTFSK